MSEYLLISDAAKEVKVESHVLRYWEEELHLPIKRNELGHRFYTREDVERFRQIKDMKERGLQLKAIKMILKDGRLDIIGGGNEQPKEEHMGIEILESHDLPKENVQDAKETVVNTASEDRVKRLQWILGQMMKEAVRENNQVLCQEIKESVVKELDYQFRLQEEREEERDKANVQRSEEYYRKMDELLRLKSSEGKKVRKPLFAKKELPLEEKKGETEEKPKDRKLLLEKKSGNKEKNRRVLKKVARKEAQKKRHFII